MITTPSSELRTARLPIYQEDPDWCGHTMVSLRTWACADCDRPVTAATRARLEQQPTVAPPGHLWVLITGDQDVQHDTDDLVRGYVEGVFTDRSRIARRLIRSRRCDADHIRDIMRRTHWYQGVTWTARYEGWEEEPDSSGVLHVYELTPEKIDL